MKNKIKLPKTIKLFLFKQLKKVLNHIQLPACTYPKTICTGKQVRNIKCHEPTLFDVYLFILKNFPSYYDDTDSSSPDTLSKPSVASHADFALSRSSSSMELSVAVDKISVHHEGLVAVALSNDSHEDLRSSMMNMLEAHHAKKTEPVDQDFLEEFLLCCLEINEKHMHKSILRAYTDITAQFHQRFIHERENFSDGVAISSSNRVHL